MLTKQNYDDVKWELHNAMTSGMFRYYPESTVEKVLAVLEANTSLPILQDFAFDTRGE
jgi:hypothetical protein|tara:strand:- start:306 stop:479 length:174 start_codon:yes stop_codon:yes gene_type:complete